MQYHKGAAMAADELGVDPWAVFHDREVSRESPVSGVSMLCLGVVGLGFGSLLSDEPPRLAAAPAQAAGSGPHACRRWQ
jgi:hypothetical protein